MKKQLLYPLNLQFFAGEDESENNQEIAEPENNVEETLDQTEDVAEEENAEETEGDLQEQPLVQSEEQNRIFANMRREAEQKSLQKQAEIDRKYAEMFKGAVNPETGKPVTTASEYLEAVEAKKRVDALEEITNAGINPDIINHLINENPVVRQAKEAMAQIQQIEAEKQIAADIKEISKIDSDIKTIDDLMKLPEFGQLLEKTNMGLTLTESFKLIFFNKLESKKQAAAEQSAINKAKSKNHLTPTDGNLESGSLIAIPSEELSEWKSSFPGETTEQLTKRYTKLINKMGV